jgi:hypothetical protein
MYKKLWLKLVEALLDNYRRLFRVAEVSYPGRSSMRAQGISVNAQAF